MAKIHTHYDNLKVARMAPQEVIRAAYKALSQKYHPDKNPGDEKAARIMAILNGAYDTLSDTQRRREHDEWIAAEEWEIEWLESTRHEDGRGADKHRHDNERWQPDPIEDDVPAPPAPRARWKWWGGLLACLLVGWMGGAVMTPPQLLIAGWGKGGAGRGPAQTASASAASAGSASVGTGGTGGTAAARLDGSPDARDAWAAGKPFHPEAAAPKAPPVKVVAMSQVVLPNAGADCDTGAEASQTLLAPNGEPWPAQSGYVEGFSVGNRGDDMQLMVDNANNTSAVFIKVYDVDRRANVRYAYVQAHDKLMVDKLANGKYEIRYQNLDADSAASDCGAPAVAHPASRTAAATVVHAPSLSN